MKSIVFVEIPLTYIEIAVGFHLSQFDSGVKVWLFSESAQ